jgi:hypothetical protein
MNCDESFPPLGSTNECLQGLFQKSVLIPNIPEGLSMFAEDKLFIEYF